MVGVPETDRIEVERHDGVAVIALNRPDVHNAMNEGMPSPPPLCDG